MKSKTKGFTLAELLMVVVILAILGGIALPRFYPQKEKAFVAEALGILSAIRQSEEAHRLESVDNSYLAAATDDDASWLPLGLENPASDNWDYDVTVTTTPTFAAEATRKSSDGNNGLTITLDNAGVFGGTHPQGPNPD